MFNIPNAITLLRLLLAPVIAVEIATGHDTAALALFSVSAVSDLLDGAIARRWNLRTRFGALVDPLADKSTMLTVAVLLTLQRSLPWWFALAMAARDVAIVTGVLAYRTLIGPLEMAPSRISKLNTVLEFLVLLNILAVRAGLAAAAAWSDVLILAALATIAASGAHYVVTGTRMVVQARRSRPDAGPNGGTR